jgi:hypothetical protein
LPLNSIDDFKYIAIQDELTQPQAQAYCSGFYKNGSLCNFESVADWIRVLHSIYADPNRHYWTNHTNDTSGQNNVGHYLGDQKCLAVKYDNETGIMKFSSLSCCEQHYFICKTTHANATTEGILLTVFPF